MASWHPTMIFLFLSFPLVNAAVRWRNSQWSITHHLVADKHILLLMKSRTFVLFNWCGRLMVACFSKVVQQVKGASAREIPSCKQLILAGGDFLRARVFCQRSFPLTKLSDKLLVICYYFCFSQRQSSEQNSTSQIVSPPWRRFPALLHVSVVCSIVPESDSRFLNK